jgi:citrate lyase subunit beta / citryl-CoA lyase
MIRSLLLVGPRPDTALKSEADALVLPAEGAAEQNFGEAARLLISAGRRIFIAIASIRSASADACLDVAVACRPCGVILTSAASGRDVARLDARIGVHEAVHGVEAGSIRVIAGVGATAASILEMASFVDCSPRLTGMLFDPLALAAALGCQIDADAVRVARAMVLASARAAGVQAIHRDRGGDIERLASRDGFDAMMTDDPDRIASFANRLAGGQKGAT